MIASVSIVLSVFLQASTGSATPVPVLHFLDQSASAPISEPPHLWLGLGDNKVRATIDTGSTGVVISADAIPDLERRETLGPGELTYSSSGRIERGVWLRMPVTLTGADGVQVASRPVAVLAVTSIACAPAARRCTPETRPEHVAMVGIGFAREHDHQARGTPDNNPLLNLDGEAGKLRRGYLVRRDAIVVGAPDMTGFQRQKLAPDPEFGDWRAPTACVQLGQTPEACGHILVDTGVTRMFLTVPPDRITGQTTGALGAGTPVTVRLGDAASPEVRLGYSFTLGGASAEAAPSEVVLSGIGKRATYVNTGVRFLNRFDVGYDADNGWFGYRPRAD